MPRSLWPLQRVQQLRVVLVAVILFVGKQRKRTEQCRRFQQQRKATLVASRFDCRVHAG